MKLLQIDAFTDEPFKGNPAAVCLLDREVDDQWMQAVAAEMNLSETAFVGADRGDGTLPLRWFTPTTEIDLCGHATLASAHVLWREAEVPAGTEIRFATRSGVLTARDQDGEIQLDFPATPTTPAEVPAGLQEALGVPLCQVGRSRFDYLVLSPFWSQRLGRTDLIGFQASRRGGVVRTRLKGDRVVLGGRAVTVLRGELT